MIEIAFGDSAAASLKMAKSAALGGSPEDVEALTLALDIGDISDVDTSMDKRRKQLDDLFADFPDVSAAIWKTAMHALTRLQKAKETLEPVRMWICACDPGELCGLYFVCHLLADAQTKLSVIRIPEKIEKADSIISYRNTGEIDPEALSSFTGYEEHISEIKRRVYANIWSDLKCKNAPLRAIINGTLISVQKEFYDFGLRANMTYGEFMIAQLIGKTLGQIPGVSDRWLFLRIQEMLRNGELRQVSAAKGNHPYSGVVKRSSEMKLRKATIEDLMRVTDIFNNVIDVMNNNGIHQWDRIYPSGEILREDILNNQMFLVEIEDQIASAFVLNKEYDEEYKNGDWQYKDCSFYVVHRLCVNPVFQGKGVGRMTMLMIEAFLREKGIETVRLDAFSSNPVALRMYEKLGYKRVGEVMWRKGLFYLFEKKIQG